LKGLPNLDNRSLSTAESCITIRKEWENYVLAEADAGRFRRASLLDVSGEWNLMVDDRERTQQINRHELNRLPTSIRAALVVLEGKVVGDEFELKTTETTVGRGADADMTIDDKGASRLHFKLVFSGSDRFELTDLGSTNGTVVNGKNAQQVALAHGDKILVGGTLLQFIIEARGPTDKIYEIEMES